ncbi:MAG: hypothetical protein SWH61_17890 [Thermodesulfobacteriota bacterium]|nr:hypothetical protein [Thermodesulfobacteriota bacterium]
MGKKSLFQPTSDAKSEADKKETKADSKGSQEQQPDVEKEAAPAPEPGESLETVAAAEEKTEEAVAPEAKETGEPEKSPASEDTPATPEAVAASAPAPKPALPETPSSKPAASPRPSMGQATPPPPPPVDNRRFDSTSGDDSIQRFFVIAGACLGFVILLVVISSALNAGRYYIRETKGAVEVWKGNFTPVGRDRVMILHGARWDGEEKDAYTKAEVYDFAARTYMQRALFLLNDTGLQDLQRIYDYLEAAGEISMGYDNREQAKTLTQVADYLDQAAVLHGSSEPAAQQVKNKRIDTAKHALEGLLVREDPDAEGTGGQHEKEAKDKEAAAGH